MSLSSRLSCSHTPSCFDCGLCTQIPAVDFFGSVLSVELTMDPYDLLGLEDEQEQGTGEGVVQEGRGDDVRRQDAVVA